MRFLICRSLIFIITNVFRCVVQGAVYCWKVTWCRPTVIKICNIQYILCNIIYTEQVLALYGSNSAWPVRSPAEKMGGLGKRLITLSRKKKTRLLRTHGTEELYWAWEREGLLGRVWRHAVKAVRKLHRRYPSCFSRKFHRSSRAMWNEVGTVGASQTEYGRNYYVLVAGRGRCTSYRKHGSHIVTRGTECSH